jgi:oligoribonuclease (3'-5' exoribonuclease)
VTKSAEGNPEVDVQGDLACDLPEVLAALSKRGSHQALADIHDSIAELRHYRQHFFR